jgi:UDP-glucose 4-epimerase
MKVLITGGAGFIGSNTAERLINNGHEVIIIDNFSTGEYKSIPFLQSKNIIKLDIPPILEMNNRRIERLFEYEKFDAVIHLAAQVNVRKSIDNPLEDSIANINASLYIFELCKKYNVKRIVFSSSGGTIYGEAPIPTPEILSNKLIPNSPYGIAKLSIEHYLNYYKENRILDPIILRYGNVYGPRQTEKSEAGVISIFLRSMLNGKNPIIFGDGRKIRDYVYIDDVVIANELALTHSNKIQTIFNIGTGIETDINKLFSIINSKFNNKFRAIYEAEKIGELNRSCLDISSSKRNLNWEPKTNLEDGISKTYEWIKKDINGF